MTLIEGVGEEVTDFFIIVGVLLIGWLAWCSTNISDQPLIRTVLILQHRTRTRIAELAVNNNINSASQTSSLDISEDETRLTDPANANDPQTSVDNGTEVPVETNATTNNAETASEEVLIEAMDSFNNDESRLLQRPAKLSTSDSTDSQTTVSETNQDVIEETVADDLSTMSEDTKISIKLKFINDDQKLVTGNLKEMLGDFKRRHFQDELESQKLVRLVFNGQVLQPDSKTLERCGLFNNCVVHCLVHQPRPASMTTSSTLENSSSIYFNPQTFQDIPDATGLSSLQDEWDLSRLLCSILTLVLGLAWYSHFHYSQLFTVTTTLALYALTAVFTASLFGHFFSNQDNARVVE
ncbi:transmembrane and ubiquitin-like domain-containing protein 1 [Leptopilina boulardi]|uniref:transmembrane and ubiquitin-like domain-containing protein 1 n=1 Tax=Leptopilina boulardi TaxID=63433 RepID=UPI0021F53B41|nr:transmembrane and ubiquitin-like domain-containing protein 1 [Leptopilina boulardi]XP_051170837.1 transmembrane and ubiquitin-like domain-containing protein 1 [Leptopilina boulardi]